MTNPVKPVPECFHTVTPYMIVNDAAAAIDFYQRAFGATELMRHTDESGKIRHAEVRIGNSPLMLTEEFEYAGLVARAPVSLGATHMQLYLYVEDVDALFRQAVEAGAKVATPVENQFYGDRVGGVTDPFGHVWWIATHVEDVPAEEYQARQSAAASNSGSGSPGSGNPG